MWVKPAPGLKVRDPETKDYLPTEGREVSDFNLYFVRRLRDGDVVRFMPEVQSTSGETAE